MLIPSLIVRAWFNICNGKIVPNNREGVMFIVTCELKNWVEGAMCVAKVFATRENARNLKKFCYGTKSLLERD